MKRILWASGNPGKFVEAQKYVSQLGIELVNIQSIAGNPPNVPETADSYVGNALIKAQAYFEWSGLPSLADDSGLEVEALHGGPGIYSARYAGINASAQQNNEKLLTELQGIQNRKAQFVCALVLWEGRQPFVEVRGILKGQIGFKSQGQGGFGYDSVFMPDGSKETLAALKEKKELVVTHRIKALQSFMELFSSS